VRTFKELTAVSKMESILTENTFDNALNATWKLLEESIFQQFLKSSHARFYVWMKQNEPVNLNQLQLSNLET